MSRRASSISWSGPIVTRSRVAMSSTVTELGSRPSATTDRKSTRLNSSHANISYAVFCLKKKKTNQNDRFKLVAIQTDCSLRLMLSNSCHHANRLCIDLPNLRNYTSQGSLTDHSLR